MFQDIFGKIKNIEKIWWILLAVVIVGTFLRVWNHHDWLRFNADQGRDAIVVSNFADGKTSLPMLGPKAGGTQFRLGPAFYYFQIAAAKIFGNFPEKMAYPDLFASILTIPLLFLFLRKYFDKSTSLFLTAIFAVSAYAVRYARFAWNPNSTPFWTILLLYSLHEVVSEKNNRKFLWAIVAGIAIGVGVQLHTTLLVIFPITTVAVFAYFFICNKKITKYFFVILMMSLLLNAPQLISEYQTKGNNIKAFFAGLMTKNQADNSFLENTIRGTSCWIQSNLEILSGFEISDDCSFDPRNDAGETAAFLFGVLYVIGGTILGVRYFLKETNVERKSFLGIIFAFTGITYFVFLLTAFELSVRFYLILIFLPFALLGFWIKFFQNKFKVHYPFILLVITVPLIFLNLYFVQKSFAELANYDNVGGGSVQVLILEEAEVFSDFIVANANGQQRVYIDGDQEFLHKAFTPLKYLVGRSGIRLSLVENNSPVTEQYFQIVSQKKKKKMLAKGDKMILQYQDFGNFSMLLVRQAEQPEL